MKQRQKYDEMSKKYDISRTQARTLSYLAKHPGINQKQVAEYVNVRGSSASDLLKGLEKNGYIERYTNAGTQDRSKKIFVTTQGLELIKEIDATFAEIDEQLTEQLTEEEINTVIRIIEKIEQSV